MPALATRLLGPPRVQLGGTAVPMKRRKPLTLLAYLAVTGQRHSRNALAELLYPGQDPQLAFTYLRSCLFHLRGSIGESWVEAEQPDVALTGGSGPWVDVAELRED